MVNTVNQSNTIGNYRIQIADDASTLADDAARLFVERANEAVQTRGMFYVALSGGNTPRALYEKLASDMYRDQIDWSLAQVFFSDERFVPQDSPESNGRLANDALLSRVPINERFVHRVATENIPVEAAAANYEEGIRRVFAVGLDETPRFDLILLGLGTDGHTASLFPDTAALTVDNHLVVPNFVPKLDTWRVTFTYPLINAARCVAFLVSGHDKAEMARRVLALDRDLPASGINPASGDLIWLFDRAAAPQTGSSQETVTTPGERANEGT